jgi:hypothetical protein
MSNVNAKRDLDQMLQDLNRACASATMDLQRVMKDKPDLAHSYIIPEMEVEIAVVLTSEGGFLRAVFSDKETTQTTSRLKFKYVAVPRPAAG